MSAPSLNKMPQHEVVGTAAGRRTSDFGENSNHLNKMPQHAVLNLGTAERTSDCGENSNCRRHGLYGVLGGRWLNTVHDGIERETDFP